MKILIVEDDKHKREQVARHITALFDELKISAEVITRFSYQSGLRECVATKPDLLILDMTMPTFDLGLGEPGGRPRHFAGRDILRELRRRSIQVPTIVFTGFGVIGEGNEQRTRSELTDELKRQFADTFQGTVSYTTSESSWKNELTNKIIDVLGLDDGDDTDC